MGKGESKQRARAVGRLRDLADRLAEWAADKNDWKQFEEGVGRLEAMVKEASGTGGRAAPEQVELSLNDRIEIWCDGSCSPNPGPGGWGVIMDQGGKRIELSGGALTATNNIMEMTAAIEALKKTPPKTRAHITTDSRYVMDGITKWIHGWKKKGWRKSDGKPVLNQSLWKELDALVERRHVTWEWVAGHTGHAENERCDELANEARRALTPP